MFPSFTSPLLLICPLLRFFNLQNRLLHHKPKAITIVVAILNSSSDPYHQSLDGICWICRLVEEARIMCSSPVQLCTRVIDHSVDRLFSTISNYSHLLNYTIARLTILIRLDPNSPSSLSTHTPAHPHDSPFPMMPSNIDRPVDARNHVHSNTL